ncbi:MAG: hypothetical protein ABSE80_02245 [Halobacteriota archaeon]|jgi:NAD-specific glutamate dehydrogenase
MKESNQKIKVYNINEDELLDRFGIERKKIDDFQLLCLPENFLEATSREELYATEDSDNLCKSFSKAGLKSANTSDLNLNPRNQYAVRKSFDVLWLGVVWVVSNVTWELTKVVLKRVVQDFVVDFLEKQKQKQNPVTSSVSFSPEAKITLILRKDDETAAFEYFDEAEEMLPSLDKKVEEFFSNGNKGAEPEALSDTIR